MIKLAIDDEEASSEYLKNVVRQLRLTAKLGKIAQKALDDIKSKGFYEGRVHTISVYRGSINSHISSFKLDEYKDVTREQAPSFDDLKPHFGDIHDDRHGGHEFKSVRVYVNGLMFDDNTPTKWTTVTPNNCENTLRIVGNLRLKKTGLSFEGYNGYNAGHVFKLNKNALNDSKTVITITQNLTLAVTARGKSQFSRSIKKYLDECLPQEGVTQKFIKDMIELGKIYEVHNS